MVKVYKTNVDNLLNARSILNEIRSSLPGSEPSFDLEDCDNVLRIENSKGHIDEETLHKILSDYGHSLKALP